MKLDLQPGTQVQAEEKVNPRRSNQRSRSVEYGLLSKERGELTREGISMQMLQGCGGGKWSGIKSKEGVSRKGKEQRS